MRTLVFTKMVASGNDFVVIEARAHTQTVAHRALAKRLCDRKYGIGADGLLVLGRSTKADVRMRIFNADGSEAAMCGNGARCAARYIGGKKKEIRIETGAGLIQAKVSADTITIRLTAPTGIELDVPVRVNGRSLKLNRINTGVPHAVIFVEGIDSMPVRELGRDIRFHGDFAPRGTNVDFVEVGDGRTIAVRTYERGVEDETLACGTGSTAAALIVALHHGGKGPIKVKTKSKELLWVYFKRTGESFKEVWLEGSASRVFTGTFIV